MPAPATDIGARVTRPWDGHELVQIGPHVVHAATAGPPDRPTVVLVHGLGCSYRYWRRLTRRLAPLVHVVAVDLPGFGRSRQGAPALTVEAQALALRDWSRATGRHGAAFVAHSAGCQVVANVAALDPSAVGASVLIGPTVDPEACSGRRQVLRLLVDIIWERPTLPLLLLPDYLRAGPRRLRHTFRSCLTDPIRAHAGRLPAGSVVLRGERDPVAPRRWAEALAAAIPAGRVVEVPRSAHAVHHRRPEDVAAVILGALDLGPRP